MLAYNNDPKAKTAILRQLKKHHDADEIVKGQYWENGKGCAVGCTIYSGNHSEYEPRFGIPQVLARLEDTIFEGLPNADAKLWPRQFMKAIKPGTNLSRIGWKFLHWLLTDGNVLPEINNPTVRDAIKQCADVLVPLTKGEPVDVEAARAASDAASRAASRAASAASYAASYAASRAASRAASDAASAASRAASYAASDAASDAASRAASAASYAASRAASYAASDAASDAAYQKMAAKLLLLLKEAA